ncbi:hypothetical protein JCM10207_000482 [Rhodosporidiobolus poonsookiae]
MRPPRCAAPDATSALASTLRRHCTLLPLLVFLALAALPTCCAAPASSSTLAAAEAATTPALPSLAAPGLPSNGLVSSGIHLGFLPNWSVEGPRDINAAMGAGMAAIGDYINVSPTSPSFAQMDYHESEVVRVANSDVRAVYIPAVLFGGTLDQWTDDMSDELAQKCAALNRRGVIVWVRWCFEMNGGWMPYGLDPDRYVSTFRRVHDAIRAVTNETYMLWAPNVWSGDVGDSVQGYTPYWPGQEYVDVVGLSLYSFGPYKSINRAPSSSLFRDSFTSFYNLFAPSSNSSRANPLGLTAAYPLVISETSAPYYYTIPPSSPYYTQAGDTDIARPQPNLSTEANRERYRPSLADPPYEGSDDELFVKASWLAQLTGNATAQRFPNLKLVNHFNYLKKGNGTAEVLSDFRIIGGNATVEQWVRDNFGNQTAYEQGYTGAASSLRALSSVALAGAGLVAALVLVA